MYKKPVKISRCSSGMNRRDARGARLAAAGIATCAAAVLAVAGPATALPAGCSQSGVTVSCSYTSGSNAFTVPAGVSSLHVVAVGGSGAANATGDVGGGDGARVAGDLSLSAGDTLYAVVGGNASANTGGNNGGAAGATTNDGGGGGGSDVRTSQSDLFSRLLVAAGGGGAGVDGIDFGEGIPPGGAGGAAEQPGAYGAGGGGAGGGGGGAGTSTQGGLGGPGGSPFGAPGCPGADGSFGSGGAGATGSSKCLGSGGGGGGGGLYGGGGGGAGLLGDGSGGGGGGSNLVPSGGSSSTDSTRPPEVEISYTSPADVSVSISGPSSAAAGSKVTYLVTVANAGPVAATNVVMSASVPFGTKFQSVSTNQGSCTHPKSGATSGTITCSLGDLSNGATALPTVSLKLTQQKGGNVVTVAQAYSTATNTTPATPDPNLANNVASFSTAVTK